MDDITDIDKNCISNPLTKLDYKSTHIYFRQDPHTCPMRYCGAIGLKIWSAMLNIRYSNPVSSVALKPIDIPWIRAILKNPL